MDPTCCDALERKLPLKRRLWPLVCLRQEETTLHCSAADTIPVILPTKVLTPKLVDGHTSSLEVLENGSSADFSSGISKTYSGATFHGEVI